MKTTASLFIAILLTFFGSHVVIATDMSVLEGAGIEALYGDEEFISIATGNSKPIYKAPAVASVITAQQIEEMGARNLNDILETVPGIHVGLSAINRMDSVYSIRGIHTGFNPQVLFLLDGIPFSPPLTGSHPTLFRLPVSAISRVEVIRGPGSALYGADAYAGVINIISKNASEIGSEVGGSVGSFDSQDVWLQHGVSLGDWKVGFSFEFQSSDGDKDRIIHSDYQTILDQMFATDYSLAPGPLSTRYDVYDTHLNVQRDKFDLKFWNWHLKDAGVGAGASLALDPIGYQDENIFLADMSYIDNNVTENLGIKAQLTYVYQESDIYLVLNPPGVYPSMDPPGLFAYPDGVIGNPSGNGYQIGTEISATYSGLEKHQLRFGVGAKHQSQDTSEVKNFGPGVVPGEMTDVSDTPYVSVPDSSRNIYYLLLQDEWQFAPDWEVTTGIRYDYYSDFGNTLNPRIALVWSTLQNLTTKLLYGRAFRAPSFQEQFADQNPVTLGNPDLDPETIDTVELAFDYRPTFDIQTNLSFFSYWADGLIEYVPSGGGTNTAENSRDQEGYGLELEVRWDTTDKLTISGNYALQYSVESSSEDRTPDAPTQQAYLNFDWSFLSNWSLFAQANWVGKRPRAEGDLRSYCDDYILIDMTVHRRMIMNKLDLSFMVRNVFDEDAREPSDGLKIIEDYPLEGRSLWCTFRYRF